MAPTAFRCALVLAPLATLGLTGCATGPSPEGLRLLREPQVSGVNSSLRGLSAVDGQVAWASGSGGTVLRTLDGGTTWERIPTPPGAEERDLRDVEAFDAERALVLAVDAPARIWRTADGGAHWELVLDDATEGAFLDAMAFLDPERGFVWGDPVGDEPRSFLAFATSNGGRTWSRVRNLTEPLTGEAGFAASGTCVAALEGHVFIATGGGPEARVLHTPAGGRDWTPASTPLQAGAPSKGIFSLAFRDADAGVAVGGDYQAPDDATGCAAWTDDAGASWHSPEDGMGPSGYRSGVAFCAQAGVFFAVGRNGSDVSIDDGRTWRRFDDRPCQAIAFARGALEGWAVGAGGTIDRLRFVPASLDDDPNAPSDG